MNRGDPRQGIALRDVLLVVAVLALTAALAYPRVRRSALEDRVDQAVADVQAVVDAVERFRAAEGRWPEPVEFGAGSGDLAPYLPQGFTPGGGELQLDFQVWVTSEEAPPLAMPSTPNTTQLDEPPDTTVVPTTLFGSLVTVSVRATDPRILAGLLERFGGSRSFLHVDRWTLVFSAETPR